MLYVVVIWLHWLEQKKAGQIPCESVFEKRTRLSKLLFWVVKKNTSLLSRGMVFLFGRTKLAYIQQIKCKQKAIKY